MAPQELGEGEATPSEGEATPSEGEARPGEDEGEATPSEDEGEGTPGEGEARPGEARQKDRMLEGARLELVRLQAAMLEAEVEVEEVVEEQQLKKKRFKSNPVTKLKVILENEDAIVEWAATHPELYRGHSDCYMKERKTGPVLTRLPRLLTSLVGFSCHFNDSISIAGCLFYNVYVCPECLKC